MGCDKKREGKVDFRVLAWATCHLLKWKKLWNNRLGEKNANDQGFVSGNVKFEVSVTHSRTVENMSLKFMGNSLDWRYILGSHMYVDGI